MTAMTTAPALDISWLRQLRESVPAFLATLRTDGQPGRYLPCLRGATPVGRAMALPWSCFALKLHHMLGLWDTLPETERREWMRFVRSFQRDDEEGAFIDPPEIAWLEGRGLPLRERAARWLGRKPAADFPRAVVLAETKQAIATLDEIGTEPTRPFRGFPATPRAVRAWFEAKDWTRPWGAGGQSAGLVVFLKTQAPRFLPERDVEELLGICREFLASLADTRTGAYFRGAEPEHGELINGAMKVLMALEWLDVPPHYADRLVATCLRQPPSPRGCHLVDAIYVLHRCLAGREGDRAVREFCGRVSEQIRQHANPDGSFSFHRGKAQIDYYGVRISRGMPESDIQATCLLIWALAMIWRMLAPENAAWRVMKP
jgi:hypothetical protein